MPPQGTPSLSCQRKRKRTGRAPAGHAVAPRPCDPAVRAARRVPIGSAATAVARRRGGDCAASEWSGRARARRIRHVRRLRRHWSRAPALWQLAAAWLPCRSAALRQSGVVCTNSPGWREAHALCATCRAARAHELVRAWERGQQAGELGAHTRSIRRRWIVIAARQSTSANQD